MSDTPPLAPPPAVPPSVPPQPAPTSRARRSILLKVSAIGAIVLLLLVPLMLLDGLIRERQNLRDQAQRDVAAQWGLDQTVGGPVLTVPYTATVRVGAGEALRTETRYLHLFPDSLSVVGTLAPEVRTRGIFRVVLYNTKLTLSGRFPALDASALGVSPAALRPGEAFVQIGIPDMAGIRQAIRLRWGGTVREAEPGIVTDDVFRSGVSVPVALPGEGGTAFRVALDLNGSGSLGLLPVGKTTTVRLESPWATPSFTGAFLPEERSVTDAGFAARWRVLHLNRNFPQAFTGRFGGGTELAPDAMSDLRVEPAYDRSRGAIVGGGNAAFGVRLLLPVDEYQKTERAAAYGLLLVLLTFTTFFFVEILSHRRFHPVQYLLVGLAVTLFYLLLLAFAEYLPFDGAYGLAAVAILALVTLYARAVFAEWRLAGVVGGLLALFYGTFYVLLQLEAYALLFGSLALLVTLATVMYLSRRVDWYGDGPTPPANPRTATMPESSPPAG